MPDDDLALAFLAGTSAIAVVLVTATWASPAAWLAVIPVVAWTLVQAYRRIRPKLDELDQLRAENEELRARVEQLEDDVDAPETEAGA